MLLVITKLGLPPELMSEKGPIPADRRWGFATQNVAAYRGLTAANAPVSVLLHGSEVCSYRVEVRPGADTTAPTWIVPPRPEPDLGLGVHLEAGWTWQAALSEPGYLVFWTEGGGEPARVTTFPAMCCGPRFGFALPSVGPSGRVGHPTLYDLLEPISEGVPSVVRPMDLAGNLGDAFAIDPALGSSRRLTDAEASAYRWTP